MIPPLTTPVCLCQSRKAEMQFLDAASTISNMYGDYDLGYLSSAAMSPNHWQQPKEVKSNLAVKVSKDTFCPKYLMRRITVSFFFCL